MISAFLSAFRSSNIWNSYIHHFNVEFASWDCLWRDTSILHNRFNRACAQQKRPIISRLTALFLHVTPIFHVFWTLGPAFVKSTKKYFRIEQHFSPTITFRRIHRRIRSPRMESLEIRTERTFVNTKHKVTLPSHDRLHFFSLFSITVLNTS